MDNLARIIHELKAINADLEAYNNKEMAIGSSLKDKYVGCIYCGEPKGDSLNCCGENHFEEMDENDD